MNNLPVNIFKLPVLCLIFAASIYGCSKSKTKPLAPGKTNLIAPAQNSVCTTGVIVSNTQSNVTFTWQTSSNAYSYLLFVKNLITQTVIQQKTTSNTLNVLLQRETPYSWYVVARSTDTTINAQSDVWKFYNSGLGVASHIPFPADAVAPTFGQKISATGTITLSWSGNDVDNDIVGYDVYFGATTTPALIQSNVIATSVNNIAILPATTYYWKIITKDSQGNSSTSDLFQFSVN